jgi:Tfp pilus assembly protein PilV
MISTSVMEQKERELKRQRGMASIVITMVTMVVISLIVLGFATISRREQRQSLDQLLSSQAFYAAESGIEDAKSIIKANIAAGTTIVAKDACNTNNAGGTYPTGAQTVIDSTYSVSYTCLRVDPSPDNLQFDGVDASNTLVIPVKTAAAITSVKITWKPTVAPAGTPADCPASATGSFSPQTGASGWACGYGVLRADLVPTMGVLTRAGLQTSYVNGFFVPIRTASAGTLAYAGNLAKPNIVAANCGVAAYTECSATINNITGNPTSLAIRLSSMYQSSNVTIQAYTSAGVVQDITGVQAMIDSTGKATDVLRRIQVRLPLVQTGSLLPGAALSTNDTICKRFSTATGGPSGGYFNIPGDIVDADPGFEMCAPKTDGSL